MCTLFIPFMKCANSSSMPHDRARWFATQVQPHESAVRGYLRSCFPSVDIDDVVQESYLKIWRYHDTASIAAMKAYFFSTARNTALNWIRRRKIYADTPVCDLLVSGIEDGGPGVRELINKSQQFEMVVAAMGRLPGRCRDIVALTAMEGLSNREIAVRLNLAESTVRVQMARGIRKMAAAIQLQGGDRNRVVGMH